MSLPERVRAGVERTLVEHGLGARLEGVTSVAGGCINHGARVETDTGAELFLKWNHEAPAGLFEAEADGLAALASAGALRVPTVVGWDGSAGVAWLLLEYVAQGRATRRAEEALGRGLARLHAAGTAGPTSRADTTPATATPGPAFGWHRDNWIGSLPQDNTGTDSWARFWRDRRVAPQLALARRRGHFTRGAEAASMDRLVEAIGDALADVARPELVHGDLWGGNWFASATGEPVLIDPAVHLGHGEVDLAMSELFGGFGDAFYAAYREARGRSAAYVEVRRDLYQLYNLLVHVNLFGASYVAGSLRAARSVCAALGR